jgi:hypothetical protein
VYIGYEIIFLSSQKLHHTHSSMQLFPLFARVLSVSAFRETSPEQIPVRKRLNSKTCEVPWWNLVS